MDIHSWRRWLYLLVHQLVLTHQDYVHQYAIGYVSSEPTGQ